MDSWVVGQLSFWYTVYEVKPAVLVDKIIKFWIDLVVPGNGAGESNLLMKGLRTFEQSSQRMNTELNIRQSLRDWDMKYPQIHHELIVRYVCGAAVSVVISSIYNSLTRKKDERYYYH